MQTATEYLDKTESATRKLFEGVESYIAILESSPFPIFSTWYSNDSDLDRQLANWAEDNKEQIAASIQAQRTFTAQSFAQATLCGSILQVAAKALECYSTNQEVPADWQQAVSPGTRAARFCIGRRVRKIPLGLIIYAGRNQHMHFEDQTLRDPNVSVFDRLALNHEYPTDTPFRDPAFDLSTTIVVSMSNNITGLIGWRSYEAYMHDMHLLLNI